jgi:hypothetical protein
MSRRELNRATLARQSLLTRSSSSAVEMIEHLVGMQAQNHNDPYYALWSRLESFRPAELSDLVASRDALRIPLLRSTIHLVTSRDALRLRSIFGPVLARTFGSTAFARDIAGVDREALLEMARRLLEERPRTRAELGPLLAERWPERVPASLAQAATYLIPVVQVTPRGIWQRRGPAAWSTIESWLGRPLEPAGSPDDLVVRYLGAFGPAAQKDIRVWSGLTGLAEVVQRLRPRLRTFRDEKGIELFDLADAPRPHPDTPAPPRFLPEYDNLLLSHSDRSRFFEPDVVPTGWVGNLMVDGIFAGGWKVSRSRDRAELRIELGIKMPRSDREDVVAEGYGLLDLTDPAISNHDVRVLDRE